MQYQNYRNMLEEIKARPVVASLPVLIIGTYDAQGVAEAFLCGKELLG